LDGVFFVLIEKKKEKRKKAQDTRTLRFKTKDTASPFLKGEREGFNRLTQKQLIKRHKFPP